MTSENLVCTYISCTGTGRSPIPPAVVGGSHRETVKVKPMMHGTEKSDLPILPKKRANKAVKAVAEFVEGRGGNKRNAELQSPDAESTSRVPGAGPHT